jgi:DNA-directed RNA polymerase specialized sigma subunit
MNFTQTRARRTDSDTSHEAAKAAVSTKSDMERRAIRILFNELQRGLTAREVANITGIDYIEVQRRISECGLTKTTDRRDGCAVWTL